MTNDIPKPISKAETRKLEKDGGKVGKNAPKEYTGVQYGAQVFYHEGQKSGCGAILQPAHGKCANLWLFSYKLTGSKCDITSCEYKLILISEIDEYLQGFKRGEEVAPTVEIEDCIEEHLASKGIGISF
jgi:hypothetical protein